MGRSFLATGLAILMTLSLACAAQTGGPDGQESLTTLPDLTQPTAMGNSLSQERGLPGKRQERLTLAMTDQVSYNFNPFAEGDLLFPVDPSAVCQTLYQSLLVYWPESMAYQPLLAEKVSLEGQKIRIQLPAAVIWHDGFPLTPADVLFSMGAHQELATRNGLIFDSLIESIAMEEEDSILIQVKEEAMNGGIRCLEALARTLILPSHLWEPLLAGKTSADDLSDRDLPRVGSGPWVFLREDEFALSFSVKDEASTYVSLLKYQEPLLAKTAFIHGDLDLLLFSSPFDSFYQPLWQESLASEGLDLQSLLCGERLAGISLNPQSQDVMGIRAFRQLLHLAADTGAWSQVLMPASPAMDSSQLLTIPSLTKGLDGDLIRQALGEADQETINRKMTEAGLIFDGDSLKLEADKKDLRSLKLVYPFGSEPIEAACQAYKTAAKELGIDISLKGVSRGAWQQTYLDGSYDLIYQETEINESPALLSDRLLAIPGLVQEDQVPTDQFDGSQGLFLIQALGQAQNVKALTASLEDLSLWMAQEALFIPLAAGSVERGIWNPASRLALDPLSIFPQGASLEVPRN